MAKTLYDAIKAHVEAPLRARIAELEAGPSEAEVEAAVKAALSEKCAQMGEPLTPPDEEYVHDPEADYTYQIRAAIEAAAKVRKGEQALATAEQQERQSLPPYFETMEE